MPGAGVNTDSARKPAKGSVTAVTKTGPGHIRKVGGGGREKKPTAVGKKKKSVPCHLRGGVPTFRTPLGGGGKKKQLKKRDRPQAGGQKQGIALHKNTNHEKGRAGHPQEEGENEITTHP